MTGRSANSVWMGDIDNYMDERVIAEAFSMMGEHVVGVKLLKDHKTGQNRNFCFVELTSKEAVNLAIRRLTGVPLPNYPAKRFKLNFSLRDQTQDGGTDKLYGNEFSIYVGGLNFSTTDDELRSLFSHYKSIKEAKIVRDEQQRSKGFGFVRFYTEADREAAILQMNGAVGPMGVTLRVDKAMPKRELQAAQAAAASAGHYMGGPGVTASGMMGQYPQAYGYGHNPYAAQAQLPVQAQMPAQQTQPVAQRPAVQQPKQQEDDDETLEDHSAPVNMVATNLAFIQANQDFYKQLADSRWNPITSYTTTISDICQ